MGIGKRIKKYRLYKGLKAIELSKIINISQGSLSEIENENTKPSADTITSLVTNTDIEPHWLLTGEGKMLISESAPLRLDLMKNVIEIVEKTFIKNRLSLQPNKKAELIILLFEELVENETKIQHLEERILRLMKFFSES